MGEKASVLYFFTGSYLTSTNIIFNLDGWSSAEALKWLMKPAVFV
jgi:hypothetical protein